jgi:hypothetical protein
MHKDTGGFFTGPPEVRENLPVSHEANVGAKNTQQTKNNVNQVLLPEIITARNY